MKFPKILKMTKSQKLSLSKIKKLLLLFKYIVSQKREDKIIVLRHLDNESIDNISESIYNLLYNEKLNSKLSPSQKTKIKRIIRPNITSFEDISKKKIPSKRRQNKLVQHGTGMGTILLTLIPIFKTSFLTKK